MNKNENLMYYFIIVCLLLFLLAELYYSVKRRFFSKNVRFLTRRIEACKWVQIESYLKFCLYRLGNKVSYGLNLLCYMHFNRKGRMRMIEF